MLFSSFLTLAVVVATVSSRSIGDILPTLRLPTSIVSSASSPSTEPQCMFHPHQPSQRTISPSSIPSAAWPHISHLLTTATPLTSTRSRVQTLRLSSLTDDFSLEGIVLGLVYTAAEPAAAEKELRDLEVLGEKERKEVEDRQCLWEAVKSVVDNRQMEGVLEVKGRGRVGFLVYRVD